MRLSKVKEATLIRLRQRIRREAANEKAQSGARSTSGRQASGAGQSWSFMCAVGYPGIAWAQRGRRRYDAQLDLQYSGAVWAMA